MSKIYKAEEWCNGTGDWWFVDDISDLGHNSAYWYHMPRILNISACDFVLLLKDKFNAGHFYYSADTDVLIFGFKTQAEARKFKNYLNKKARETHYLI